MERSETAREGGDHEKWVDDSSLDYKENLPLRASTGVWTASLFIITIEFSERLSYFGIHTNLISYLTKVIHQDIKTAAKNVNYWAGVTTMMPLIGGFLADAYTGSFMMVLIASLIYLMGLSLLTLSQFIPSLRPCETDPCGRRRVHEVVFFLALYLLSTGTGGHKPCLESFGADQFDDNHVEERKKKMSYFNWWNFALCCGLVLGVTVIAYVQDDVGWGAADLILTITMAVTIATFCMGRRYYRYRPPEGSPLIGMLQVLVAALRKRNLSLPSNPALLFEVHKSGKSRGRLLRHTNRLRLVVSPWIFIVTMERLFYQSIEFLDKAAILEERQSVSNEGKYDPWRLATLTRVEELKLVLNMIPIWLTALPFGVCVAQASTFFVKQGATMNRKVAHNFEIPPASTYALSAIGMLISVTIYDKILVPILRKYTGNERGINILQRIGFGMIFSVAAMTVAALVEKKRLKTSHEHLRGRMPPLSVFWLGPQFIILGCGDGFTLVGLQEYFYDQVPDSMRSLGIAIYLSVIGGGSFLSSFLITIVDHTTKKIAGNSWFGKNLNESHLDYFYWLLAAINVLNLCVYVFIAKRYTYKSVQRTVAVGGSRESEGHEVVVA